MEENDPFDALAAAARRLADGLVEALRLTGFPATGGSVGSMWGVFFHEGPVDSFEDAREADTEAFSRFHAAALERGVFLAPSAYEVGFVSTAHTPEVVDETLAVFREAALAVSGSTEKSQHN